MLIPCISRAWLGRNGFQSRFLGARLAGYFACHGTGLDLPPGNQTPKSCTHRAWPGHLQGTKCVLIGHGVELRFMTETKFLWVFTSRIIYLTKTNMHNLFLLLCFFLFFVLVTDKHETCSCWINIIILAVENSFLIQNMSYSL